MWCSLAVVAGADNGLDQLGGLGGVYFGHASCRWACLAFWAMLSWCCCSVALVLLHEPVSLQALFTYVPIWIAVGLVSVEGILAWRREAAVTSTAPK